jgi:beta-lactamase regulating signal transducer with metallopeptidase domain
MIVAPDFHGVAIAISQRLLFSAIGGTLLAASVWFLLQLFPKRDSGTNFAVWFSTLLATALLPILSFHSLGKAGAAQGPHAVFTVSSSVAWTLFLGWAIIAMVGLVRIVVATRQVRRLRRDSVPVNVDALHVELRALIEEAQKLRPVAMMTSERLEVPTAIGFRNAAVILPAWMLENTPAEELKYILLHELAHVRRRDDWTNLAQKLLKALLFFLPSVWWIERRLSLDREMACDDAVLAHSGSPRGYAECLAHLAERSFLRRQFALAQAAVGRVRQLTARVTRILDPDRPQATQTWKPALPVIIVLAGLCALPASFTPELVRFADDAPAAQAQSAQGSSAIKKELAQAASRTSATGAPKFRAVVASLLLEGGYVAPVNKRAALAYRGDAGHLSHAKTRKRSQPAVMTAKNQPPIQEQYVMVHEEAFFVVTQRTASGGQQSWQMHVVQFSVQPQGKTQQNPRKI